MAAIVDPDILDQLEQASQAPQPDQNGPAPAGGVTGSSGDAPPLTIRPKGAPQPQAAAGPITDPALLAILDNAPPDPAPQQPSTAKDMAVGLGSGLVRGAAAVPGMFGDIGNAADYATCGRSLTSPKSSASCRRARRPTIS